MSVRISKMLTRQYCSTPAASVQEAMAHVSSAAATLRNAVHLPPADFDAQLATAHRAASDAQAIVREMDKFEQADHISLAWVKALPCLRCAVMAVPIVAFLPTLGFHYGLTELASSE